MSLYPSTHCIFLLLMDLSNKNSMIKCRGTLFLLLWAVCLEQDFKTGGKVGQVSVGWLFFANQLLYAIILIPYDKHQDSWVKSLHSLLDATKHLFLCWHRPPPSEYLATTLFGFPAVIAQILKPSVPSLVQFGSQQASFQNTPCFSHLLCFPAPPACLAQAAWCLTPRPDGSSLLLSPH